MLALAELRSVTMLIFEHTHRTPELTPPESLRAWVRSLARELGVPQTGDWTTYRCLLRVAIESLRAARTSQCGLPSRRGHPPLPGFELSLSAFRGAR
jgi:hypothetical protein